MRKRRCPRFRPSLLLLSMALVMPGWAHAQSFNGSISGTVEDPSGAVVADAEVVVRNSANGVEARATSGSDGRYAVRNLVPGTYELTVTFAGFQPYQRGNIRVSMRGDVRVDVGLSLGAQSEVIEVATSTLTYDSGAREDSIAPDTLEQLPLVVSGTVRSSAALAILMPGVSTGGQANAFDARINGGMQSGDEAVLDGVSMQQGFMSQSGMVSIFQDFPFSPDMVSEVKVVTSSYEPQYGSSTSGQLTAVTKSGTDSFHGSVFEYFRNDSLNATQWGADSKPENTQHNFGGNIGGPAKIPGLWSSDVKSYFYVNLEGFRQTGGVNRPTLSIPSLRQRNGDFTDWRDANGNLIPIYDPATTRVLPDGTVVRDQFMGCDGQSPNVICPDRISPWAQQWLQFLPTPTNDGTLNNYQVPTPVPDTILADSNYVFFRFDSHVGSKDHFSVSLWHQRAPAKINTLLPIEIANETDSDPQNSWVNRFNWDHTFSNNVLNHLSFGYLNRNEGYGCVNRVAAGQLPDVAGVVSNELPPQISFSDGFESWGCNAGVAPGTITTRPTFIVNDLMTWVTGNHTLKFGFEWRSIQGNIHNNGNQAGSFNFGRGATGLLGVNSGSPIASFLLGTVNSGNVTFRDVDSTYPRQSAWILHAGDTWHATPKLTLNYGLRWDYFSPSREKFNRLSFFDPDGANPGAGGRPGRLAFAGTEWGEASYGDEYPEKDFWGGFAPRLGVTYALNDKTVLRAGWGIFYDRAFYPGWGGGMSQDGFASNVAFNSTLGGLQPAFLIEEGFPQNFVPPPFIQSDFRNGQGILYRPLDANERPRSHQWNVTIDRELGPGFSASLAYVGSRGLRLPSNNRPLNALNPSELSRGNQLYDEFQPGQASLHGVPLPYDGWVEQMTGCAPSLAQALLPYPQYCSSLQGLNENHGKSIYHSLQAKVEKRFSEGTFLLVSYTLSRLYTSGTDNIQRDALTWSGASGVISPFEEERNRALAVDDVTHLISAALVWDLPFARDAGGLKGALLDGWQLSTIFRYSSGIPYFFRSGFCNVPGQFRVGCIPAVTGNVFAQDPGSFDPGSGPLFTPAGFESTDAFNFYYGNGDRVTDIRGYSYKNQDLSLIKNTRLGGDVMLQIRLEAFNIWNWHIFGSSGTWGGSAFNTDVSSPDFGQWNGSVSNPRNIQLAARISF